MNQIEHEQTLVSGIDGVSSLVLERLRLHDHCESALPIKDFLELMDEGGAGLAGYLWPPYLKGQSDLSALDLFIMLAHFRNYPRDVEYALHDSQSRLTFATSLANLSSRVAGEIYEYGKAAMAVGDLDRSLAAFEFAIAEYKFAMESGLLSDKTLRIDSGKYAVAVVFASRLTPMPVQSLLTAIGASMHSFGLGNTDYANAQYRSELLLRLYETTRDKKYLLDSANTAATYLSQHPAAYLIVAETKIRLASITRDARERAKYLDEAREFSDRADVKTQFDQVTRVGLSILISLIAIGEELAPQSLNVPYGLLDTYAKTNDLIIRNMLDVLLDQLRPMWFEGSSLVPAVVSARVLKRLVSATGSDEERLIDDLHRYVEVTSWIADRPDINQHHEWEAASALLQLGRFTNNLRMVRTAGDKFRALADGYPSWPLPVIGQARSEEALQRFPRVQPTHDLDELWRSAAHRTLYSTQYQRRNLGGRSNASVVDDARGFMATSFVFKEMRSSAAEHESLMMQRLATAIEANGEGGRFAVPRSIVRIPWSDSHDIHVTERSDGRPVAALSNDERAARLFDLTEYLALYHRAAPAPPAAVRTRSHLRRELESWLPTLMPGAQAKPLVTEILDVLPDNIPLVLKRDAHAENWLIDNAGKIVAVDLESSRYLPIGYDLAQLIEDGLILPAEPVRWSDRLEVWSHYLELLDLSLGERESGDIYSWFALLRAIWLGTSHGVTKAQSRHARSLSELIASLGAEAIRGPASQVAAALRHSSLGERVDDLSVKERINLSKALARLLRHRAPEEGLTIDDEGFASLELVASVLGVSELKIREVIDSPDELRFQHLNGKIRALYGHSLPVHLEPIISASTPHTLYHGSNWLALDSLVIEGIQPMGRTHVHLSTSVNEAITIARRRGSPVVLEIEADNGLNATPVADGLWIAPRVTPDKLRILNPSALE